MSLVLGPRFCIDVEIGDNKGNKGVKIDDDIEVYIDGNNEPQKLHKGGSAIASVRVRCIDIGKFWPFLDPIIICVLTATVADPEIAKVQGILNGNNGSYYRMGVDSGEIKIGSSSHFASNRLFFSVLGIEAGSTLIKFDLRYQNVQLTSVAVPFHVLPDTRNLRRNLAITA